MLRWKFNRYQAPADDGMGGGASDRGDDFTPTGADADPAAKAEVVVTEDDLAKAPKAKAVADAPADEPDIDPDNPDADPEDKPAKGKKDSRIPLARHLEILAKERERSAALERQLQGTRQGEALAATNEQIATAESSLLTMEADYTQMVVDGKSEKAAAKMTEIRRLERSINEARSTHAIQVAEGRAYERVRYDTTVERLEAAYPQLNQDHDSFDADLMAEVVELRDGYVATGKYSRAEAIQKAAKTLAGTATTRQIAAVETDVRVDKDAVAKSAAAERAATQRAKNGKVAATQPPLNTAVGIDHDKLGGKVTGAAVMKMPQEAFAKLDEATLSSLRGDDF